MVGDYHYVPYLEFLVHASGCIGDDERLYSEGPHYAYGEGDGLHVVSLIVVETALHGHDALAGKVAEDEVAAVALYGGYGEVGDGGVWNHRLILDHIGQGAETGSENNGDSGHIAHLRAEKFCCLVDFF